MEKQKSNSKQANARFYAAAQRFRTEGDSKSQGSSILSEAAWRQFYRRQVFPFCGAIVYLGTKRRNTDRVICSGLMQKLVSED